MSEQETHKQGEPSSSATRERPLQIKLALSDAWLSLSFCPFEMKNPLDWEALPTEERRFEAMEIALNRLCASLAGALGVSDEGSNYVKKLSERKRHCVQMRVKTILAVGNERFSGPQGLELASSLIEGWAAQRLTHWVLTEKTGVEKLRDAGKVVYLDHQFRHEREVEGVCVAYGQQSALAGAVDPAGLDSPRSKPRRI